MAESELGYTDKFDTVPEGQNWLWWHFKRGGCFILSIIAVSIVLSVLIYLLTQVGVSGLLTSSVPVLIALVVGLLAVVITVHSVGGEVYNRLWRPCEQAPK